jgi:hypothetical protein
MTKAQSQNDTTLEGVKTRKLESHELAIEHFNTHVTNIVKGHFVQRKLHSVSLKRISKSIKNLFRNTPRVRRPALLEALEEDLSPIGV